MGINTVNVAGLLPYIANELGQDWAVDTHHGDHWLLLVRDGGLTLHVGTAYREPGKLHISACVQDHLKKHLRYNESEPSINVSGSKTSAQIATDIKRRLLPLYEPLYKSLVERAAEADQVQKRVEDFLRQITARAPQYVQRATDHNREPVNGVSINQLGEGYGKVMVREDSDGNLVADIDLRSIPASAVLGLLATYNAAMDEKRLSHH